MAATTFGLGVVVAVTRHPPHPQRAVSSEEVEYLRPVVDIGVDLVLVDCWADDVGQIGARGLEVVIRRFLAQHGIARNPDATSGPGGGSAPMGGLFDDEYRKPVVGSGDRGGHPGGAGADHQYVDGVGIAVFWVHDLGGFLSGKCIGSQGDQASALRHRGP